MKSQKIESQKLHVHILETNHKNLHPQKKTVIRYYLVVKLIASLVQIFKYLQVWLNGNIRLNKTTDVEENADYAQHFIFQGFH